MLGIEMMFKSLGIDPNEIRLMMENFGKNAEAMRLSQERTERMVQELHAQVFGEANAAKIENKE